MGQVTHKMSYSKIYRTWIAMISRCRNENDCNYKNYGARGIFVCDNWYVFENFYSDMGDLPFYEAQIDRINNNDGYYKENCRWVSSKENSRNRRNTKKHKIGRTDIVQAELLEKIGWTKNQFRWFLNKYGISWILDNFKNGTLPKKTNKTINRVDIVGSFFGKWNVIEFTKYTKKEGHLYLCKCECGFERLIPRNNLIRHKTTKCRSCSAKEFWNRRKYLKLKGGDKLSPSHLNS